VGNIISSISDYNDKIIFRRDGQNSDPFKILEFEGNAENPGECTEIRLTLESATTADNTIEKGEYYIFDYIWLESDTFKVTDFSNTEELAIFTVEYQEP